MTGSLTSTDVVLIVMGSVMLVCTALLLAYFLYQPKGTQEEQIPLRTGRIETPASERKAAGQDIEAASTPDDARTIIDSIFSKGGMLLHTSKGPRNVNFYISDSELQWSSPTTNKKYIIQLQELKQTESGKKTANFLKKSSAAASEELCFSLLCQATSIDIEAASPESRNRLVEAFDSLIAAIPKERNSPFGF